jgi:2-methylcitrate dehydratase PrpD
MATIAFKPYPCGTMIHPYIDCARRQWGVDPASIREIVCGTAEGIVHRLWEPLAEKQAPPNAYAAKFSVPYCVAYAILNGNVGLDAFTDANARDPEVVALARKVRYELDPANPYPDEYTGHLRISTTAGETIELTQPHLRGGQHEPLSREDLEDKFRDNCAYGEWDERRTGRWIEFARTAFDAPAVDLAEFRG